MTVLLFLIIVFVLSKIGWLPAILGWIYLISSMLTLVMYGFDKLLALKERQRISERALHLLSVLGGWPGAYLGQQLFRHKTAKKKFRRIFWFTVFLNIVVLIIILKYQK